MEKTAPILITGANGFIGKNLVAELKNRGFEELLCFDIDTDPALLEQYAAKAAFVFHLAGVNRPQDPAEFYAGNRGFTEHLLALLAAAGNTCGVTVTSSTQAELDNDYGRSKREAEELVYAHGAATGAPVFVFRLPGVFGKWCRPNYNSVVATFCHNAANGLPLQVRDPAYALPLVYVDDVVRCLIDTMDGVALADRSMRPICRVYPVHESTLGFLAETITSFAENRTKLGVADMADPLVSALYSTWLSYLPTDRFSYPLKMNCDARGSFTEFLRTANAGQVSVNISRPGIVKGNHWHHSKNEKFLVVSGRGVIRFRKLNTDEIIEYHVSGEKLEVVDIPTGYTHNIENLGDTDMVTVMWANEPFNPDKPDTYFLPV